MIRVSEEFHELTKAHRRDEETMEETLHRLLGGPSPEVLAEAIAGGDDEAAVAMRRAVDEKRARGRGGRTALRERFE